MNNIIYEHSKLLYIDPKILKGEYRKLVKSYKVKFTKLGCIVKLKNIKNDKEKINYGDFYLHIDYRKGIHRSLIHGGNYFGHGRTLHPNIYLYHIGANKPKHRLVSNLCLGINTNIIIQSLLQKGKITSIIDNIVEMLNNSSIRTARGTDIKELYDICYKCADYLFKNEDDIYNVDNVKYCKYCYEHELEHEP